MRAAEAAPALWVSLESRQLAGECSLELQKLAKTVELCLPNIFLIKSLLDSPAAFLWRERLRGLLTASFQLAGSARYKEQDYAASLDFYLRAAEHLTGLGDSIALASVHHQTAVNYFYLGNFDLALEHASLSLKHAQKSRSPRDIAAASYIMGYVYRELKNFDLAMEYFQASLGSAQEAPDPYYVIMSLNEVGNVLSSRKKFREARDYKERALKAAYASQDPYNISTCLNDLGVVCADQGDHEQALRYFLESFALDRSSGLARETAITASNIASIYMMKDDARGAKLILEEALPAVEKAGLRREMLTLYNGLLEATLQVGDRKKALEFLKKSNEAREAMFSEEMARKVADFQAKYQTEKKQRENDLLKNDLKIQALAMSQQRSMRNFLLSLSAMIILMAAILFSRYRFKARANRLLEEANRKIQDSREELARANRRLEELSRRDPLTGLANRRAMLERLGREKHRFDSTGSPFTLIMADIDDFKSCNDLKGHDCGDSLLKSLADRLRGAVRRGDLVSRWGGDEFLILLPETGPSGGRAAAKKIQAVVSRHPFPYKGHRIRLRISLGCGVFKAGQDIDGCLKEADQAMFLRKRAAKNSRTPAGAEARRAS